MLSILQSNDIEVLTHRFADLLQKPLREPLAQEMIVVQSHSMARWLTLRLADRLGICTNLNVRFPASFLWDMSRAVLRYLPSTSAFDKSVLEWRLMSLLRDLDNSSCFAALRVWLGDEQNDFRRYELAGRIADCFDQYQVYRPDWIKKWEQGEGNHWQAELWRRLVQGGGVHRVQVQELVYAALKNGRFNRQHLPERVAVIGISALPAPYLELLSSLAHYINVYLFVLNPCQEYWGDIQAERDLARLSEEMDPQEAYLMVGNPLLASLGKQGRDFIDVLQTFEHDEQDAFVEPVGNDLLHHLQADILHLRERGSEDYPALELRPDDRSLQIHVCHGAMREVEVLHDQLLALFEADAELTPSDVAVMTPDIAKYGSLITAVFSSVPKERWIPFGVADQGVEIENPLIETFFELLDLSDSRFDAVQVLSLLERSAVRRRFALAESDVELIYHWVREVGIRWGVDAEGKRALGLPETAENTWRTGLDRLLLGYTLPGGNSELYNEILPYDDVEGDSALALGSLQCFLDVLFNLKDRLQGSHSLAQWGMIVHEVLDRFFAPHEQEEGQLLLIRSAFEALYENAKQARFDEVISLAVLKSALRRELNVAGSNISRFLGHGVTCCEMIPMRSIPFKVVCLIGMNDDAYPRLDRAIGFDLMAKRFRRGDRSRRRDDRYLFLEMLLSARNCFYLSYVGQNIRDNSALPPSVLVSELLDTVDRGFRQTTGECASEQLVTRHALQSFGQRYFNNDRRLFSYAQEWLEASRYTGRGGQKATPVLMEKLPEPEPAFRQITLDDLLYFFKNPTRWLLQKRLGIRINDGDDALETHEPFVLDKLEDYQLVEQMLRLHRENRSAETIKSVMRSRGVLPHGQMGESFFGDVQQRVTRFSARLDRVLQYQEVEPLAIDITLKDFRLTGYLSGLRSIGWVGYRLSSVKANDYLRLWLHHLLLNIIAPEDIDLQSFWIGENKNVVLNRTENSKNYLQSIVELYWQGTQEILSFFPKSSLEYFTCKILKEYDGEKALQAARKIWEGDGFKESFSERNNPYYQLVFSAIDPLDVKFEALSVSLFRPLFLHISESGIKEQDLKVL